MCSRCLFHLRATNRNGESRRGHVAMVHGAAQLRRLAAGSGVLPPCRIAAGGRGALGHVIPFVRMPVRHLRPSNRPPFEPRYHGVVSHDGVRRVTSRSGPDHGAYTRERTVHRTAAARGRRAIGTCRADGGRPVIPRVAPGGIRAFRPGQRSRKTVRERTPVACRPSGRWTGSTHAGVTCGTSGVRQVAVTGDW